MYSRFFSPRLRQVYQSNRLFSQTSQELQSNIQIAHLKLEINPYDLAKQRINNASFWEKIIRQQDPLLSTSFANPKEIARAL